MGRLRRSQPNMRRIQHSSPGCLLFSKSPHTGGGTLSLFSALFLLTSALSALGLIAHADRPPRLRTLSGIVDRAQEPKYRTDRILVRFRPGTPPQSMLAAHSAARGEVLGEFRSVAHLQVVSLGQGVSVQAALHK